MSQKDILIAIHATLANYTQVGIDAFREKVNNLLDLLVREREVKDEIMTLIDESSKPQ
jgi:hypothetical protein